MQILDRHAAGTLLARLGGADPGVLKLAPKARRDYIALALVLLATSGIAVASMTFAMVDGLKVHAAVAVVVGLFWGAVILLIDRALIISLKPKGGRWRTVLMVLPRIAMAGLLGLVISTPLTLRIFSDEIHEQMTRDQIASANAAAEELANGELQLLLSQKEAEIKKHEDILAGNLPYSGPRLTQAQQEYAAADAEHRARQQATETAYRKWQCELYGVGCEGTSQRQGNGPLARALEREYRSRMAEEAQAKNIKDAKHAALLQAQQENASAATDALAKAQADSNAQLSTLRPQRDAIRRQLQQLNDRAQGEQQEGLLAQLVALEHLGDKSGLARMAHLLVALLLFMLELLPVVIKTLSMLGPTTLYDRADKLDDDNVMKLAAAKANRAHIKQEELERLAIESERRVAVKVIQEVEGVVTEIALGAVDRWGRQARQAAIASAQDAPTLELPQPCRHCGQALANGHVCQRGGGGGNGQTWYPPTAPQQPGPYNLPYNGGGPQP